MGVLLIILVGAVVIWAIVTVKSSSSNDAYSNHYRKLFDAQNNKRVALHEAGFETKDLEVVGVHIPIRKNYILEFCKVGDDVTLEHEKKNKVSNRAILVRHNGKKIGYIREMYVEDIHQYMQGEIRAHILSIELDIKYLTVEITIGYK